MLVSKMLYKPPITKTDAKRHLRDIRCQYQKQIALIIDECEQLRIKHKFIFDNQWNSSYRNERTFSIKNESIVRGEDELPMVEEFVNYSSDSSSIFLDNQKSNTRILSSKKKNHQRCLSVSSVASIDKRANRVYKQWPDYNEISQIVGYRIGKPAPIVPPSPPPVVQIDPKKGKKSSRFATAVKQIKNMSTVEKEIIKSKPIVEQSPVIEKLIRKEIQPKLPTILCPSSKYYSKRIQTRQWLVKNDFTAKSLPFI